MFKKIIAFITVLVILGVTSKLKIQKIECHTQFGNCPDKYYNELEKYRNKSFFIPIKLEFLTANNVRDSKISKKLPGTLEVSINLRQPLVSLGTDLVADLDGVIMKVSSTSLPRLQIENLDSKDKLDSNEIIAVKILSELSDRYNTYLSGEYKHGILNTKIGTSEILIDVLLSPPNWQDSLQKLMARSKIEGKAPKKIDLRFSQPVLTY